MPPRPLRRRSAVARRSAVDDLDVAGDELPSTSAASTPSLIARAPPGCCRRPLEPRRARASASTPASSVTIADLRAAVGAARARSASLARSAGRRADDPQRPGAQLLVRGADVDHQVAECLAEPDHRDRRDRVQDELLRRAGLQPRRAGEELRADDDGDLVVGDRGELGARRRGQRDRQRPGRGGRLDRPEHVRRPAAGADADHGVRRADAEPLDARARPASASSSAASRSADERARRRRRARRPGRARSENVAFAFLRVELREAAGRARRRRRRAARRAASRSTMASTPPRCRQPRRQRRQAPRRPRGSSARRAPRVEREIESRRLAAPPSRALQDQAPRRRHRRGV